MLCLYFFELESSQTFLFVSPPYDYRPTFLGACFMTIVNQTMLISCEVFVAFNSLTCLSGN